MNDEMVTKGASVAAVVLAVVLIFMVGHVLATHEARKDAVKNGHARWVPDEAGRTTFEWATQCKPQTEERKEKK